MYLKTGFPVRIIYVYVYVYAEEAFEYENIFLMLQSLPENI